MTFLESVRDHQQRRCALLATNFYNFETLQGILRAAKKTNREVILQTSPSTLDYLGGPKVAVGLARAAAERQGVRAWLHLDHATDPGLIAECIRAGYDSVMIDASERSFEENVAITQRIAQAAHAAGVAVEAELGYVAKLGQSDITADGYTSAEQAAAFVRQTDVDLLAVAIGTAHGFYKTQPKLDLPRLESIRAAADIPLVLHGGSGLTPEQWRETVARGITKINFATEIKDTFMRRLKTLMRESDDIDLRKVFPPAIAAVTELVSEKLNVCSA